MADRWAFTDKARAISRYMTLAEMEEGCDRVRKASWWGRVVRCDESTQPPYYDIEIAGIAKLFKTTQDQVRTMITEEWFGVAPAKTTSRVRRLAPQIDALHDKDFALVESVLNRLAPEQGAEG
ncbi:hypothetical protein KVH22_14395 [Streptomyces olivaceus]|uniref:hypothetical protein n=1 Tax=Streptomyces olivaceus TaxID=47716 RepID=UPI001CCE3BEB|nr:hypothetical protein [Streptomyces olivaceus]MBZ6256725.1 hypothetical protein [Streptomyces olivaceus]